MKQKKSQTETLTKNDLKFILENSLHGLRDELRDEFKEEFRKYRDENMTRLDAVMGELQAIREDNTIGIHQYRELHESVEDHEKRIKKLEQS